MSYLGLRPEMRRKEQLDEVKVKSKENAENLIEQASKSNNFPEDKLATEGHEKSNLIFLKIIIYILGIAGIPLLTLGICTASQLIFDGILWLGIVLIVIGLLMLGSIYPLYKFKLKK